MKQIKDEFVQHHEGQAIFTARRVIFGTLLLGAALCVGVWIILSGEPS